ncbi:unnamed protein product [Hermetia illucens]|uniref:Uncharacterized protein n=1 Tax=Hermetia illucens TaxID=343691 RepID=A0A7R8UXQ4_HERIL|nr:unnamed protein product [Hermetia illucens]
MADKCWLNDIGLKSKHAMKDRKDRIKQIRENLKDVAKDEMLVSSSIPEKEGLGCLEEELLEGEDTSD